MGKALYRKYRPTSLDAVIGQDEIIKSLKTAIKSNKISHAYLFSGPRGTGKTSVARIFAHAINDFDYQLEDSYLDIIEIDAASNTSVENVRELREKAIIAPTKGKYKVYIIDEIHMLSRGAFNALLKVLEEPPAHVVFIMATTEPHKILDTIRSRSQSFVFHLADQKTIAKYLAKIAKQEKINCSDAAIKLIAKRSGGSFRDALSLLDQIATQSGEITEQKIESALGLPPAETVTKLIENYLESPSSLQTQLQAIFTSDIKPKILLTELINHITLNPQPNLLNLLAELTKIDAPFIEAKLLVALMAGSRPDFSSTHLQSKKISSKSPLNSKPPTASSAPSQKTESIVEDSSRSDFNWDQFVAEIRNINIGLAKYLLSSNHQIENDVVHIYPEKSFAKNLLSRENNLSMLRQKAKNRQIIIHDPINKPKNHNKDTVDSSQQPTNTDTPSSHSTIQKISGIMGSIQEVINDGEIPF